ncbi:hypothetical protein HDU92_003030 [Lobulomyces angularis]|nr:hypothetical protein HDU92_003030 [Lobulomyces angularis]
MYEEFKRKNFALNEKVKIKNQKVKENKNSGNEELKQLRESIKDGKLKLEVFKTNLDNAAKSLPNSTHPDTPLTEALLIKQFGEENSSAHFNDHVNLTKSLDLAEFTKAGKVTGSGFYFLKNSAVILEQALINYAIDFLTLQGFLPMTTPDLVRRSVLDNCGFQPRTDDNQTYFINGTAEGSENQLCLSATSEFPLAGIHSGEMVDLKSPIKYAGIGHCFRAEGVAGGTNRGLFRVHQFSKVEMFALTAPKDSEKVFDEFIDLQIKLFAGLGLCFRVLNMPIVDLGAPAYKKYDIEAWMPGRKGWGEISSTSNCTDYQSRRLNIRYFSKENNNRPDFVHTVNGTAVAIPRLIIAILENNQKKNGDVIIPEVLIPYCLGGRLKVIKHQKSLLEMLD